MDIFKQRGIAVVTTNTVGVMGAGVALQAAQLYPQVVPEYRHYLKKGRHGIGKPTHSGIAPIMFFATKAHFKDPSEYEYVEESLRFLRDRFTEQAPRWKYYFPPLGCGLGGLDKRIVRPMFDDYLGQWSDMLIPVGF